MTAAASAVGRLVVSINRLEVFGMRGERPNYGGGSSEGGDTPRTGKGRGGCGVDWSFSDNFGSDGGRVGLSPR